MSLAILKAFRNIKEAIVVDIESVVKAAPNPPPDPRISWKKGDFFDSETIPHGKDMYLITSCLDNWNDTDVVKILENLKIAARPSGTILIGDPTIQENSFYPFMTLQDINMLIMVGGRTRTRSEMTKLIQRAGLSVINITETRSALLFYHVGETSQ
jgi:hypothetical protein